MRKHKPDVVIGILMGVLMVVGLIMIYAIGPARANFENSVYGTEVSENYYFVKQLVSIVLAFFAFVVAYKFPFEKIKKAVKWILLGGVFACLLLTVLGWMGAIGGSLGAVRWFDFGIVSFQPAELLKVGVLIYMAVLLGRRKTEGKLEKSDTLLPVAVVMGLVVLLLAVWQKDLGTTVVIAVMMVAMMVASGVKARLLLLAGGVLLVAAGGLIAMQPYRVERITDFTEDYHTSNAVLAIGTGGLFGVGVGNSVQAMGYLPESVNDSIFAVMGETFGLIGLLLVMAAFLVMLMRMLRVAEHTEDNANRLVVIGVWAWILAHVVINVVGMTGLAPIKGITLPFLSYGGTSMVFVAIAMGWCLQISRQTSREKVREGEKKVEMNGLGYYLNNR